MHMKKIHCCLLLLLSFAATAQEIKFPLKASADKKYITDQSGQPVLLNGCSVWDLPFAVNYATAKDFLLKLKAKKFNTVLIKFSRDTNSVAERPDVPV